MMRRACSAALLIAVWVASDAHAQSTRCTADQLPNSRVNVNKLPSGESNTFMGGGIQVRCPAKKIVLKADSAEIYGDEHRLFLVGNVNYNEPRLILLSDFLTYFTAQERIVATGNVHARLPSGSSLAGPQAEYLRIIPKTRPRAQLSATGRPTVGLVQLDTSGRPDVPTMVVANTLFMEGDSLVYAGGQVQITRTEFTASGDSAFIDSGKETMRLMRSPAVEGKRADHPFKLVGALIDMFSKQRKLDRVISRGNAVATSQDLNLRADTIDLRVTADLLQRAIAWGGASNRAHATSPTQDMQADSIDVIMPNQRAREVRSYRKAFAEGKPDTTKFKIDKSDRDTTDWMRGDTILAHFDTLPPKPPRDTARGPAIRQLVALGDASSLYHLPSQDSCTHRPAISYVRGRVITVDFDNQQVALVTVDGLPTKGGAGGLYLEPAADSGSTCGKKPAAPPAKAGVSAPPTRPSVTAPGPTQRPSATRPPEMAHP